MTIPDRKTMVKEMVINSVEAPRLRGISTRHFIEFKRLRTLCEKQIEEKSRQLKEEIVPTSYRASIQVEDRKTFIAAGCIEANSIDKLSERKIQQWVKDKCKRKVDGEQLYLVEKAIRGVNMQMHLLDGDDRVWTRHKEYCGSL